MAAIRNDELLDFEGMSREIDKLQARFLEFGKSSVGMVEKNKEALRGQIDLLKQLRQELSASRGAKIGSTVTSISKEIDSNIKAVDRYKKAIQSMEDISSIGDLSIKQLRDGLSALKASYDKLDPTQKDFAEGQKYLADRAAVATEAMKRQMEAWKAATTVIKATNASLKEAKKAVDAAEGSYNKLQKETVELKKQLRALPGAFNLATGALNKSNAQAVVWQRTIERNEKALKQMDASMGNYHRNVGNYTSATQGLSGAFRDGIVQVLGVATAFEALSKSIQIIDQMTRLKLSLESVSNGSTQVTSRWQMLSGLADRTGQDLVKLTDAYVSFTAASRNTALEGRKADTIFASFANTFSALGKNSEVAERGLYAVQQMMSKGKVSSEELNQQLAEALPGANKLFADALGVSTMKLADMLKKGEVLATDVLPKVAAELQRIYGDRAAKNLETISGSWTRLTNQFVKFLDMLNEKAGISSFFSGINNRLAETFKGVNRILEKQGAWEAFWATSKQAYKAKADQDILDKFRDDDIPTKIARIRIEQDELTKAAARFQDQEKRRASAGKTGAGLIPLFSESYKEAKAEYERRKALVDDMRKIYTSDRRQGRTDRINAANIPTGGGEDDKDEKKNKRILTQYEKLTKEAEKLRGVIVDDLLADFKAGRELAPSDEVLAKWNKLYAQISAVAYAAGDSVPSNLRELNDKINKNPVNIADQIQYSPIESEGKKKAPKMDSVVDLTEYNALLGVHEAEMALIEQKIIDGSLQRFSNSYIPMLKEQLGAIQKLEKDAAIEQDSEKKAAIAQEIALEKQKYQELLALARQDAQARRELQNAAFELAVESTNAVFQITQDQLSADRESLQASLEHELSLVQGNQAAQDKIKKEYAKKDLEMRQKQAKLEKAQAAFSIGISTARAVVNALATGGPPWIGIALAAIVGAMGAVQLATVLAKPLPQFYKGTQNAPEGPAWVAERGPEIRESNGQMTLIEKPTIMPLKRGDKIFTAAETKAMLSDTANKSRISSIVFRGEAGRNTRNEINQLQAIMMLKTRSGEKIDYDKITNSFMKAFDTRPVHQTVYDENGVRSREKRNGNTTTYNDNRYKLGA